MKALTTFQDLATLTSSGAAANFPASNVKDLDPMLRWQADAYAGDVWLTVDFGSAKALTAIFLNQANFPHCHVQGNATDAWGSPSFDLGCDLVQDDAKNRKGWFDLAGFNYRWLRILISSGQTLDNSETVPALGNLIAGASITFPLVSDFDPQLVQRVNRFESDGGSLVKSKRGRARHVINFAIGDSLDNIRALSKVWDIAVVFADLGNAGDSWLVYPPESWSRPIKNPIDASLRFTLEERP